MTPVDKIVQEAAHVVRDRFCGDSFTEQEDLERIIRQALADAIKATGTVEALGDMKEWVTTDERNFSSLAKIRREIADSLMKADAALTQLRALTETNKETKE